MGSVPDAARPDGISHGSPALTLSSGSADKKGARILIALLVTGLLYGSTAWLPYFAESFTHLTRVELYSSAWQIFDPFQVPFRPLQHAFFYVLAGLGPPDPWVARIPAFALHAVSAWLTFDLARRLGCSRNAAWIAFLSFLAFPNVKGLVCVEAIGSPGRVACVLAGLSLYLRHLERPSWRSGLALVATQILALGFHQSGLFLAPFCVLLLWARGDIRRGLRDRWLLAMLAVSCAFVLAMSYLFQRGYPKSQPLAMLANFARASLALVPETVREPAIEGLRGHWGRAGSLFGGLTVAVALLGYGAGFRYSARAGRALCLLIAFDLLLPVLTVGFVVRYAYLSSALAGCALGLLFDAKSGEWRARSVPSAALLVLGLGWTYDTLVDVREYRRAGAVARRVLDQAVRVRAEVGTTTPVALVDLPPTYGVEDDIPFFSWGTKRALAMRGAPGPWLFWRTRSTVATGEGIPIDPRELETRIAAHVHPILVYDAEGECLIEAERHER